ncbi:hypothetical protein HK099_006924 [Clydaea vesicula]|uniref:Transcription factor CBF/NF-Y/archaeal histone domain-containing protein n=1 Tax=Clydaea vesicula TaxID=447962 RepID=A0AAD5U5R2_9FUNG|nr:hypothetical protein HK099_006924 [Clydaea vesicula]KAJ3396861.1 hypothetical protein HDU92_001695 [Lobulomyces angularis]
MKKKFKTRFPEARIKKIMRLDDDVGKVAKATPVLISKALEMFMKSLIDECTKETRSRNAKKISVVHLKATVLNTDKFDFLREIVEKIQDPINGEEYDEDGGNSGKGKGKGGKKGRPKSSAGQAVNSKGLTKELSSDDIKNEDDFDN